jgi:hypothetical protein
VFTSGTVIAMKAWMLVCLCACNQIFGLDETHGFTRVFDAPIDAPFACPPPGQTPAFNTAPHQVQLFPGCNGYVLATDAGLALALCSNSIVQGAIDSPMTPVADLTSTDSNVLRYAPRLSPEGDQVVVAETQQSPLVRQYVRYLHGGGDHWTRNDVLVMPSMLPPIAWLSGPTRGPARRLLAVGSDDSIYELVDDGSPNLQLRATYTAAMLGIHNLTAPQLSPDGLRIVVAATQADAMGNVLQAVWYTDRATLDDSFRPADPMPTVPVISDPFMTADCSRVYFTGIGSLWFVQRL